MTRIIQGRGGFTLMELLTVMVIMSIVLATGVVSYVGARRGAELRGAASSLQSAIAMARQHAVTKRRATAIVFRLEGSAASPTNCYYVFEKIGVAGSLTSGDMLYLAPLPKEANGNYVCNLSVPQGIGQIGTNMVSDALSLKTYWLGNESSGGWNAGDSVGSLVAEKMFLPPGVKWELDGPDKNKGLILFHANGKAFGVGERKITLKDKMNESVTRTLMIYPLVGLVKSD